MSRKYPAERLGDGIDNGTMHANVSELRDAVVGRRIVSVDKSPIPGRHYGTGSAVILTLDDGRGVRLADTNDCCAFTELDTFLLHADRIDHIITGVGTTNGYTTWHVYADMGDVLELSVGWSCGNPFYYAYGFHISVEER